MRIAIVGTGNVGRALSAGWKKTGHSVTLVSRNPAQRAQEAAAETEVPLMGLSDVQITDFDIAVLAVPWSAVISTLEILGDFNGRILVDCTNPLKSDLSGLEVGFDDSAGEIVQRLAKNARVVKAFNMTGSQNMIDPLYQGQAATMLVCGADALAKLTVVQLGNELGFESLDAGGIEISRYLEPLAMLWIQLAVNRGLGTDIAFQVLRR